MKARMLWPPATEPQPELIVAGRLSHINQAERSKPPSCGGKAWGAQPPISVSIVRPFRSSVSRQYM